VKQLASVAFYDKKRAANYRVEQCMSQPTLPMEIPPSEEPTTPAPTRRDQARLRQPVRNQVEMMLRDLDSLLAEDHPARAIWDILEQLDLSAFYGSIKAVVDQPGRPTTDPQVLLALWIYATVDGVGSARRLATLCQEHDAYRWLCGGVPVNYHTLSDFRVARQGALDQLLTEIIATMLAQKLVQLQQVAQDGVRVRASAGAASFRRQERLEGYLEMARAQVERVAQEREHPDPGVSQRAQAARQRAVQDREERVQRALRQLPAVQAAKERQRHTRSKAQRGKVKEARVSTTDPDARVMKQADSGYRPAYNVQFATDAGSGVIVGVAVINQGHDTGQAQPMEAQVVKRTGQHPGVYLMDGGFATGEDVTALEKLGITVYAPVKLPRNKPEEERYQPHYGDSPQVVQWRQRMSTDEAKAVYRLRAATAEWTNAQARGHGLLPFAVRGLGKVLSAVLLVTIAHNLMRWRALGA
jgi:transposase